MGAMARPMYPVVGLAALGRTMLDLGVKVDVGAGVAAALDALAASAGDAEEALVAAGLGA